MHSSLHHVGRVIQQLPSALLHMPNAYGKYIGREIIIGAQKKNKYQTKQTMLSIFFVCRLRNRISIKIDLVPLARHAVDQPLYAVQSTGTIPFVLGTFQFFMINKIVVGKGVTRAFNVYAHSAVFPSESDKSTRHLFSSNSLTIFKLPLKMKWKN